MLVRNPVSRTFNTRLSLILLGLILGLVFSLASVRADAQQKKTIGDILKKIETKAEATKIKKSKSNLPKFQKQKKQAVKRRNMRTVKPPSSSSLLYPKGSDEAELAAVTDEGIKQLFKLSQRYSKSSRRGELWLRLAELYVEKARLVEFQIQTKYDKDMAAFLAKKRKRRPKLNLKPAFAYNKKAIQLYEWFIRDFPKDKKVDQALFFLGYNHFELGQVKKGESYYLRLTKQFPRSPYVTESNFALGEYYFENEKWKSAQPFYEKVARVKKHRLFSFALYKLAWVNYKQNKTKRGLRFLEEVILEGRRSRSRKSSSGVSRIRLASEAIKDLIIFYAEAGDPKKARGYFEEVVGPKSAGVNLGKLATYYMDTGNRSGATYIFKDLIEERPNSPKSFDYQQNIVKMFQSAGGNQTFRAELSRWIELYGPDSDWQEANRKNKELTSRASVEIEATLRNYVLQQHQTAQNSRAKTAQKRARQGYELYFKHFSKNAKVSEMHFFYGELLFDLADYPRAAFHYNWVVENDKKSEYYEKALLNTLLALEKKLPDANGIKKIVAGSKEPVEFPKNIKKFVIAAKRYFTAIPKGDNIVAIKYRVGALHYYFNQYDPALRYFREIIKRYPKTEYAEYAANLTLDIYNLRQDYVGLQAAAEDILKIPSLRKSKVGAQIRNIKVQTDFKMAKDLEDKKEFGRAANAYQSFAKKNRANPLALTAIYNAGINFERAGDLFGAIAMYETVRGNRNKGNANLKGDVEKFLPPLYERTGQYAKAAWSFADYAKKNPKDKNAVEYHFNAAIIYDGLNSYQAALKNYDKYFKMKRGSEKFEALFLQAKLYYRVKNYSKALLFFDNYIKSGTTNAAGVMEAAYSIAKIHERRRKKRFAKEWYEKVVFTQRAFKKQGKNVGVGFAAEAKFILEKPKYDEFAAVRLNRLKTLAANLNKKLALLERLKEAMKKVIVYDDAFQIVAALNLQGKALINMYDSLVKAPKPKGLSKEELAQYNAGVMENANPFKDQAIETLQLAVKRGIELQAYNKDLIEATRALGRIKGDKKQDFDFRIKTTTLPDQLGI